MSIIKNLSKIGFSFRGNHDLLLPIFDSHEPLVFLLSCVLVGLIFFIIEPHIASTKGKAWIVMLFSSLILSLVGVVYVFQAQAYNLWTNEFIYSDDFVSRIVMLFFASVNVMDLLLGILYYPSFLDPFSTIAHHIFYIGFIAALLINGYSKGFMLCFLMEVPTFVLALGSVWKKCRSDLSFGISFFLTRILYNMLLAYRLAMLSIDGIIWKICVGVLFLHIFWFYKWVRVYGKHVFSAIGG